MQKFLQEVIFVHIKLNENIFTSCVYYRVLTKTRNRMEWNGLFHPVLFQLLQPEAIQQLAKP